MIVETEFQLYFSGSACLTALMSIRTAQVAHERTRQLHAVSTRKARAGIGIAHLISDEVSTITGG